MSQFFISCKESRIENNRSFYGCFYLGPFEPSQSITIANALRRTLLSELYGLGIVSVEIEGASHEYSSLPGVRDSVLDILLNLKEIVLKKTIKNLKPQIGYLRARGPGVVRASHLRLPPFIQCVDPDQYIATLADNGFLNLKFIIQYGNKWLSPINSISHNQDLVTKEKEKTNPIYAASTQSRNSTFTKHLKKRRLILKKLKQIGITSSNSYINMFAQSALFLSKYTKKNSSRTLLSRYTKGVNLTVTISKKYPAINLKNGSILKRSYSETEKVNTTNGISKRAHKKFKKYYFGKKNSPIKGQTTNVSSDLFSTNLSEVKIKDDAFDKREIKNKKSIFFNANPLTIDAVFNPINKVNYIIEINDFKLSPSKMQTSSEISELYEMLKNSKSGSAVTNFLRPNDVEKDLKKYMQNILMAEKLSGSYSSHTFKDGNGGNLSEATKQELETILEIKREINALKKDTIKHNITLEIWTNGSIHPRDALYQGLKHLIKLFVNLKKVNTFGVNNFLVNNQQKDINKSTQTLSSSLGYAQAELVKETEFGWQALTLKKIKMGEITSTLLQDFLPLNERSFLSTYISPKLKNYYLNNQALLEWF